MRNEDSFVILFFSLYSNCHFVKASDNVSLPVFPKKIIILSNLLKFSFAKSKIIGKGLNALEIIMSVLKFFSSKIFFYVLRYLI